MRHLPTIIFVLVVLLVLAFAAWGKPAIAWQCGCHDQHIAFTTKDVAECTKNHGCKGWRLK